MAIRVAINGFGRIGRLVLRSIAEHARRDIEVVAINDLGPVETNAHLLRYDSVHGRFPGVVTSGEDWIDVGMGKIKVTAIRDPKDLPHKELNVDIAFECTGIFTARDKAALHLEAGAKRVLVSAPADGADKTIVYKVNHDVLTAEDIIVSNGSCTTNALAPVAKVLHDLVGIERGYMTTIHSYTGDQPTLDTMHKDLYRARAAALSMFTTTDPLVSSDLNHIAASSTAALPQTQVIEGKLVRVLSWYDNEWGFATRMADTALVMAKFL
jgi:glyceraldehyde 3-phosphate dehydrogenase